ncbi:adenylate/guanylate cyclase with integral membrane sensor [Planoprotostelium fungivorum]|uniref:Adenylate/guanylate cyclase with integral membrane sensor n=1 Tax=Planoprotostelium fungivorum TaxID=1890364 RepID=A0A2P6NFN7_9EUKA|nr:adenylate/guanylate cyclase with integral membrane sensor [Planoprotostelium fungivorum]
MVVTIGTQGSLTRVRLLRHTKVQRCGARCLGQPDHYIPIMVQNKVVPFELESIKSATSNVSLSSLWKREEKGWRNRLAYFLSIRSFSIMLTIFVMVLAALVTLVVAQYTQSIIVRQLVEDRSVGSFSLTSSILAETASYGSRLTKLMGTYIQTSNTSALSGNETVSSTWLHIMEMSRVNGLQTNTKFYFMALSPVDGRALFTDPTYFYQSTVVNGARNLRWQGWEVDDQLLTRFNRSVTPLFDALYPSTSFYSASRMGPSPPCNTNYQTRDLVLQGAASSTYPATTDNYVVCDENNRPLAGLRSGAAIGSLVEALNSTASLSVVINMNRQLVCSSTNDAPFINGTRSYAPNSTVDWIAMVASMVPVNGPMRETIRYQGNKYLLVSDQIPDISANWTLVQLHSLSKQDSINNQYLGITIAALAGVVMIMILFVSVATYYMTQPLRDLTFELYKVARLELDLKGLNVPFLWEAKKLSKAFSQLHSAITSFKKFVPSQVIVNILKYNREAVSHLSQAKCTVMFQDIEGFTTLAESMNPLDLASLTEEYLEAMTEIVTLHGGTVDKYIGDCVMSIFNKPEALADHAAAACRCAVACQTALITLNKSWKRRYSVVLNTRIGINTGDVLVGNMGSDHRMNYTVIGDNVNIAARLEAVNKVFGTNIIISESVFTTAPPDCMTRRLSTVKVPGKTSQISIYELCAQTEEKKVLFAGYERALQLFEDFRMNDAMVVLRQITASSSTYDEACQRLMRRIEESPDSRPNGWTATETLTKG